MGHVTRQSLPDSTELDLLRCENTALKEQIAALACYRALAYTDSMTGLWNRRYFDERVVEEISRASRGSNIPFSILLVDINDLKVINDALGHAAGDEAITWVAAFLKSAMRAHDVCCRIGGDEFVLIVPDTGASECVAVVHRLGDALERTNQQRAHPVGLSFGAATYPADDQGSAERLLATADRAMYREKRRQKTRPGALELVAAPAPSATAVTRTGR
jgi:diguanylate cyclase (GGDEF)-like protein